MRRTLTAAAIAVLVFTGIAKLVAAPSRTAAGIDTSISTHDIDIRPAHRISRGAPVAGRGNTAAVADYGIADDRPFSTTAGYPQMP